MSFLIDCPNCGVRESEEFRFGGEANDSPEPAEPSDSWAESLYQHANLPGPQREWWYHARGCQCWFIAERNTATNQVVAHVGVATNRAQEGTGMQPHASRLSRPAFHSQGGVNPPHPAPQVKPLKPS